MRDLAQTLKMLRRTLGDLVQADVSLAPYTSARIGGPADILITAHSAQELEQIMAVIAAKGLEYFILGGGSNVLVSDQGIRGITILNRAKAVHFEPGAEPHVQAESGVSLSNLAKRCAPKAFSGLEWAATVPGTVGGAVYGNAGAFEGDMAGNLMDADVWRGRQRETWNAEAFDYGYRTSILKRGKVRALVLSARLSLKNATAEEVSAKIAQFSERRKSTQPPGASMGSMFKNPEGDYAGRLIEAAGLKGTRIGHAEISPVHGNFFINHGKTKASDMRALLELAQQTVTDKFGLTLEPEVELVGQW